MINPEDLKGYVPEVCSDESNYDLETIKEILIKFQKPLVIFGQGIRTSDSINEFKEFLNLYKTPSISSRMSLDILPYTHPYYFGLGGMRGHKAPAYLMKEADLILILGSSFTHAYAGDEYEFFNQNAKTIMVNIDASEIYKPRLNIDYPIELDLKDFFKIMNKNSNLEIQGRSSWLDRCRSLHQDNPTVNKSLAKNPINSYYFIECLNNVTNDKHIFVNDKVLNIPSYLVKMGDIVSVRQKSKSLEAISDSLSQNTNVLDWLAWDLSSMKGRLINIPNRDQIPENIKEQLIVELYSK